MFAEVETEIQNASRIVVNSVSLDLAKYKNIPQTLLNHHADTGGGLNKNNQKKESEKTVEIKTVDELKAAYRLSHQIEEAAATRNATALKTLRIWQLAGLKNRKGSQI
jgi:hypothetical protein